MIYRTKNKIDTELIVELYNSGSTLLEIDKMVGISKNKISGILKEKGITPDRRKLSRYTCNSNFFEFIDSEEKAYILGFILADGCVFKNNLKVVIQEGDKEVLNFIKKSMNFNGPIFQKVQRSALPNHKKMMGISITNSKIISDLSKLGVLPDKTHKGFDLPKINKDQIKHLIRGYFDGDGSIYNTSSLTVELAGNSIFLNSVSDYITSEIGLKKPILYKCSSDIIKKLRYHGKNAKLLLTHLYSNSTFSMSRKLNKFKSY